ncbi:hypothetical protein AAFF_G00141950 [Aldrovandia affinis]|uniref:Uncharacterized protein n=1 Tax=Aldrovandia affinis TaxID=143900 RepID=A0AAD7TCN7_9TELE|nr:hypothetical protein AAFF_G00141950 [Aldrovandia affinis]
MRVIPGGWANSSLGRNISRPTALRNQGGPCDHPRSSIQPTGGPERCRARTAEPRVRTEPAKPPTSPCSWRPTARSCSPSLRASARESLSHRCSGSAV